MSYMNLIEVLKGGAGSGNWGHSGRIGKIGGSQARNVAGAAVVNDYLGRPLTHVKTIKVGTKTPIEVRVNLSNANSAVARDTIEQWGSTTHNDDRSLQIQENAAKEFGVSVSDYTRKRLAETRRSELRVDDNEQREFLRSTFNKTQKELSESLNGATHMTLYRGVDAGYTRLNSGGALVDMNALASWSVSPDTARDFAMAREGGVLLKADIPISRIASTFQTGLGTLDQNEVVIIGGANFRADIVNE